MKKHIELLNRLRPMTAYGLVGTRDVEQAANQHALAVATEAAQADSARLEWCIATLESMKEPMRAAMHDYYPDLMGVIRTLKVVNE